MGDVVELRPDKQTVVNQPYRPLKEAQARFVRTTDDCMDLLRWLSTKTEIALDTETTGLNHDTDHARLVQIGDEMTGWAIPFEYNQMIVRDVVERFQGTYDMHNAPFDWCMLDNAGIKIPKHKIDDTRLMAHVLHSTGPLGLKPLSQRYVDSGAAIAQQILNDGMGKNGGWTWETVPVDFEPYWVYGALDTVLTKRLKNELKPRVDAEAPRSYQLEMMVSWVCEKMARKGVKVDRAYTERFARELDQHVAAIEKWCVEYYHVKPGSTDAIVDVLLREGVQLYRRTKGGRLSLDKEAISEIDHQLAKAVLSRRQAQKISSTYLHHYLVDSLRDGRVHPSINVVGGTAKNPFESGGARGVRTGRMSMDNPNLQNVPIRTKESKKIRNCFDVEDENTWIKCDFDQIEFRIFAHLSNDPALIETFSSPVDVFTANVRQIFADQTITRADDRRQYVKNGFYAIIYGAGLEQFAKTAGIKDASGTPDLAAANAFLLRLHQLYPGIKELQHDIERVARERMQTEGEAYIYSPLTHRKHTADEGREYALMNYMVQGAAGEILKMKMLEADQAGLGEFMMLPVHDEIDLEVPNDQLRDVMATLHDVMNDSDLLSVPVTSTMSIGKRWGEVEDV